ncbi:MAG: 2-oxoacid:acceptor oxidoreductase family protein, partial [Nitrososphaerota archaeon]
EILNSIGRGRVPIGVKIYVADSKKISLEETGRLIFNIPMLGALARIIRTPKLESIEEILKTRFSDELLEYNIRILKRAYSEVEMFE